jgi:hypothetical protein
VRTVEKQRGKMLEMAKEKGEEGWYVSSSVFDILSILCVVIFSLAAPFSSACPFPFQMCFTGPKVTALKDSNRRICDVCKGARSLQLLMETRPSRSARPAPPVPR